MSRPLPNPNEAAESVRELLDAQRSRLALARAELASVEQMLTVLERGIVDVLEGRR